MPPPQMTHETTTPENSTLVIESQSNSIQTWDSILRQAIRIIAPRYRFQDGVVLAWKASTDSAVSKSTEKSDARYLTFFLHAISRDNVVRAALAVKRLLNSKLNAFIKQEVKSDLADKSESIMNEICQGIKESITHHTNPNGGT